VWTEYCKAELVFRYPAPWLLSDEDLQQWPHRVSVQSPTGAYWEVQVFPADISPLVLSRQAMDAYDEEYPDLDAEPVSEEIASCRTVGFDVDFFCLDFLITGKIRSFCHGSRTYLVTCQGESREFARLSEEFDAITRSLLAALNASGEAEQPTR
jgi:hypothetical protein